MGLWLGDQYARLLTNLISYGGKVTMLTVTAPGADVLPWDCEPDAHPGVKCSGKRGCKVRPSDARQFNEDALRRWSQLWGALRTRAYRRYGPGALRLLAYVPEPQARGVIHYHLVFGAETARELAALRWLGSVLPTVAPLYGWGPQVHLGAAAGGALSEAGSAAGYVAKYLSGESSKGSSLRELLVTGQAPRRAVYVSPTLTKGTRCTMRNLRARRYVWARTRERTDCATAERRVRELAMTDRLDQAAAMYRRACDRSDADGESAYVLGVLDCAPAIH